MPQPSKLFMVRPMKFSRNEETAITNSFQKSTPLNVDEWRKKVLEEFDALVNLLRSEGVEVMVIEDDGTRNTPDSIFPNNWISFHETCNVLYPMMTENRRRERDPRVIDQLKPYLSSNRFFDFSIHEKRGLFLEGTGSMVFDHERRIVYAALSPRTHEPLVNDLGRMLGFVPVTFHTSGPDGNPIYHTNVVLTVGTEFAMLGAENIPDEKERANVISFLERSGKKVVLLSKEQINSFAGNAYQLKNAGNESLVLMSTRAFNSLHGDQKNVLSSFGKIIHSPVDTIEDLGGGSVRCMIAHMNAESEE